MVWHEIPEIPFQINMNDDDWFEQLKNSGQANEIFNQPKEVKLDDGLIKQNILNGLNMGNKYISEMQDLNNIKKPQTQEEIDMAHEGEFNQTPLLNSSVQKKPTLTDKFIEGYRDNYDNPINRQNFEKDPNKNWSFRLGEGLGSVGRFVDSPLGRGLIAAGLNSALGYDNSFKEGLTAFVGRQNAVTADKLYRNQLKQYGYTDEDLADIRGNITSDMYKNLSNNLYRSKQMETRLAIANTKDKTAQAKMILNAYHQGVLSEQDTISELNKYGIDLNQLYPGNETLKTQSQINLNNARINHLNRPKVYVKKNSKSNKKNNHPVNVF